MDDNFVPKAGDTCVMVDSSATDENRYVIVYMTSVDPDYHFIEICRTSNMSMATHLVNNVGGITAKLAEYKEKRKAMN